MKKKTLFHGCGSGGFTLVEIMLALLVITVGMVAMTGLLGTALDTSAAAHDDLHAVSFADMVFNYYHATDWANIPTDSPWIVPGYNDNIVTLNDSGQFTCNVPGSGGGVQETYTVRYLLDAERVGSLKRLTLQVWPGHGTNGSPRIFQTELYDWAGN